MRIRTARDADYAEMARLRRQTIRHVNAKDYSQEVIRAWAARAGAQNFRESADACKRWVALDGDRIIGFCEINLAGELSRIYTHKDHIGKGVGTSLLSVAEQALRKQGCKEVRLESTVTARDFYKNRGYKITKEFAHETSGATVYKMLKKLR